MKHIDLPSSTISPQPAQPTGEQTVRQQQYTNGATASMSGSIFAGQIVIGSKTALTVVGVLASAIIGGGWLLAPAKDRDLQDLRREVAAVTLSVSAVAAKVDKLVESTDASIAKISDKVDRLVEQAQEVRVDVARMQGTPAPAAPSYRAKATKQKPKTAEKPASILGF